ncbi:MAG: FHA domain-containing protein [Chloroflexi bacterium]|nr:FHA domain-containing protein [Chloroflexota bacterium]
MPSPVSQHTMAPSEALSADALPPETGLDQPGPPVNEMPSPPPGEEDDSSQEVAVDENETELSRDTDEFDIASYVSSEPSTLVDQRVPEEPQALPDSAEPQTPPEAPPTLPEPPGAAPEEIYDGPDAPPTMIDQDVSGALEGLMENTNTVQMDVTPQRVMVAPVLHLVASHPEQGGSVRFSLHATKPWTVGRTIAEQGHYVDVDLTDYGAKSRGVSRTHAEIFFNWDRKRWMVTDHASGYGTFVDEQQVPPQQEAMLNHGQVVRFGGLQCRVEIEYPEEGAAVSTNETPMGMDAVSPPSEPEPEPGEPHTPADIGYSDQLTAQVEATPEEVPVGAMLQLLMENPDSGGEIRFALRATERRWTVGRTVEETGHYVDVDLGPYGAKSRGVSRKHAELYFDGAMGRWLVVDLGGTYGTFQNDTKLTAQQPAPVADGDVLRFGGMIGRVIIEA